MSSEMDPQTAAARWRWLAKPKYEIVDAAIQLERELAQSREIEERQRAVIRDLMEENVEVIADAHFDNRTGLLNQNGLQERYKKLCALLKHDRRAGQALAFMIDIDGFKSINDTYTHKEGHRYLKAVAESLSRTMRPGDITGRYGGDEFMVFVKNSSVLDGFTIAKRMAEEVRFTFSDSQLWQASPTLSIGMVEVNPQLELEDVAHLADIAMYESKKAGGNRVSFYGQQSSAIVLA